MPPLLRCILHADTLVLAPMALSVRLPVKAEVAEVTGVGYARSISRSTNAAGVACFPARFPTGLPPVVAQQLPALACPGREVHPPPTLARVPRDRRQDAQTTCSAGTVTPVDGVRPCANSPHQSVTASPSGDRWIPQERCRAGRLSRRSARARS